MATARNADVGGAALRRDGRSTGLEDALDAERGRLADLLHDGPLSGLIALRQDLMERDDPGLEPAIARLGEIAAGLRTITRAHQGDALAALPVDVAIREIARVAGESGRATVKLDLADAALLEPHGPLVRSAVLELTTNAVRHGRARTVRVTVARIDTGTVELAVHDDGSGWDAEAATARVEAGHVGLSRLRDRVGGAGGSLDLDSCAEGMRVTVRLPVEPPRRPVPAAAARTVDTLLAVVSDPWIIIRTDATYAHVSDAMCELVGYTRDEILDAPVDARPWFRTVVTDPERAARNRAGIIARTIALGHHTAEIPLVHRDGRAILTLATSHLLPDRSTDGRHTFLALFRDITGLAGARAPDG